MTRKQAAAIGVALLVPFGSVGVAFYWLLTRCRHRYGRPFTILNLRTTNPETYVVCLECTRQFEYDLHTMKVGKELPRDRHSSGYSRPRASGLDGTLVEVERRRTATDIDTRQASATEDPIRRP